jgi:hypothetical protein
MNWDGVAAERVNRQQVQVLRLTTVQFTFHGKASIAGYHVQLGPAYSHWTTGVCGVRPGAKANATGNAIVAGRQTSLSFGAELTDNHARFGRGTENTPARRVGPR